MKDATKRLQRQEYLEKLEATDTSGKEHENLTDSSSEELNTGEGSDENWSGSEQSGNGIGFVNEQPGPLDLECGDSVQEPPQPENLELSSEDESGDDATINFNSDEEKAAYILQSLQEWGCEGVTKNKLDDLLKRLNPVFPSLPKSYKSLLHTPRNVTLKYGSNGQLWYKSIVANLQNTSDLREYLEVHNSTITLDIGIDGLPVFGSGTNGAKKF